MLSDNPPERSLSFNDYDVKIFDDVDMMIKEIRTKDREYGLCRTVSGYSWKWNSKNGKVDYDIEIDKYRYIWNTVNKDWINSSNSINEIGCIHTVQGYDLNYVGVIFGNEIKYNKLTKTIEIDKSQYYDMPGKTAIKDPRDLKNYIINIYLTLMTRGIRSTYLYVCDKELRQYLKHYFGSFDA